MFFILLGTVLTFLVYYIYQFGRKNEDYFVERGLKHYKPVFLVGNLLKPVLKQISHYDYVKNIAMDFPDEKLLGFFDFRNPVVMFLDPELIKQVTVKDFDSFVDHRSMFTEDGDPIFGNALFFLKGQKWKDMRATLSPAFTGSKMRLMCNLMVEICEQMVDFLKTEASTKGPQVHDVKKLFSRLTIDVIGTCAFGVKVNSLQDDKNEFYVAARKIFDFNNPLTQIKLMLFVMMPKLMKSLKISMFPESKLNFLKSLILDTMKVRKEKNIIRPDMINLLLESEKGNLKHNPAEKDSAGFATVEESEVGMKTTQRKWTDNEIVAQCFVFFIAGFEATSNTLTFAIYEIVTNPGIQDKLFDEIKETHDKRSGKPIDYEGVKQLKYLDMVISEVLRKWNNGGFSDRVCNKDFTLKYDDKEYKFLKGDVIFIPAITLHYHPKYFPNPDKFDPERFSDHNKDMPYYMPFGNGPRNCIGSRFALMELKTILYYMILNFHMEVSPKTQIPLQLKKSMFNLESQSGVHVQFHPRN